MSKETAVRIRNISKKYKIGALEERPDTLGEHLKQSLSAPFRRAKALLQGTATGAADLHETIWALRDINVTVEEGEVVGFIGPNGAGKSTLLKIVSRITDPTEGEVVIRGRVGSLLEVGTGFHKELTGRENVFLNGAILGMPRADINDKFDEIIEFAGTERFVDTPIKHYSTGMKVRLAFAVAAHLEPEVLVVDEVLSVGDAEFQQKCLGKMGEVSSTGRTVLFVSHNMGAVTQLCDRVALIRNGRIQTMGSPREVVSTYLAEGVDASGVWVRPDDWEPEGEEATIESVRVQAGGEDSRATAAFDGGFRVEVGYSVHRDVRNFGVLCRILDQQGVPICTTWDIDGPNWDLHERPPGRYVSRCEVPAGLLRPGRYYVTVGTFINNVKTIERRERIIAFEISGIGYPFNSDRVGILTPQLDWDVERVKDDQIQEWPVQSTS